MLSTKQVLAALGLLTFLALWRNIQLVPVSDGVLDLTEPFTIHTSTTSLTLRNDTIDPGIAPHKLIHWTMFGLGHRLLRTTAAWHLAKRLGVGTFKFQWRTCGEDHTTGQEIFPYLFGKGEWSLPRNTTTGGAPTVHNLPSSASKNVLVRNDVYGYLPAQTFQDHFLPLNTEVYKHPTGPFLSKITSDMELYSQLRDRYVFANEDVTPFVHTHRFADHTVIGIHLRAGNGEQKHFTAAGRGIVNETDFALNLVELVHHFWQRIKDQKTKPPLVFLATDTAYLLPIFTAAMWKHGVSTIVLPQIRVADNQGVTFSALHGQGEKCLLGWRAMVSDMILLSHSDVLIAARHSSFTQSMPLSLLLKRKQEEHGPHFCEADANATKMSCFQDLPAWLFRDDPSKAWMFSLDTSALPHLEHVHHKCLIHLPDIELPKEYSHVVQFLEEPLNEGEETPTHTYGKTKFNPKYRNRKTTDTPGWNFVASTANYDQEK